ncbi:hypothetical protein FH972_005766 [Carpinus fangiana]|uniref:Galactinol--sucrose galactosyltransferase n=1 Tax=Carpinus fangiana TaxID=176857 RepID=A0A5N6QTS5_9ROSI|nr:hypothetical protein FH972_005766 [Carpinus fangiana]
MKEAYGALRVHLNTFRLLEEKTVPNLVDEFGWCAWDAFYLTVEPADVWHGMNEFTENGVPPRFLILDDGWQSINLDGENPDEDAKNFVLGGIQMTAGFTSLMNVRSLENTLAVPCWISMLFLKKQGFQANRENYGMKAFTRDLRKEFKGLDDVYVWHALCGAWGGVRLGSTHPNAKIISCKVSPGLDGTMKDLAVVKIVEGDPEYVSEEYGGRVKLAKAYYKGLTSSLSKNFGGSGLISSMQQCNDFFFLGTNQISMGRVSEDFWGQDPNGDPTGVYWLQGLHIVHCAYNTSRAISGGPIYVSDTEKSRFLSSLGC